jgi:hypothetical protein
VKDSHQKSLIANLNVALREELLKSRFQEGLNTQWTNSHINIYPHGSPPSSWSFILLDSTKASF